MLLLLLIDADGDDDDDKDNDNNDDVYFYARIGSVSALRSICFQC